MSKRLTKAVIPAAGLGTRFLPATKAMPKEMLPVVDKPAIQYVVEEAVRNDLTDVLMITGRNKNALENHFDNVPELESALEEKGDQTRLLTVTKSADLADMHYVRQGAPRGLGHAVLRSRMHVGDNPFAVLLGDDLVDERDDVLGPMIAAHAKHGATVIALMEVPSDLTDHYGIATVEDIGEGDIVRIVDLVEKPNPEDAPSNLAVLGRYVLEPAIYDILETTEPGKGNEIQLTDALRRMAHENIAGGVYGFIFRGRRYDTGDKLDYIKAIVRLALQREDLGPMLEQWLDVESHRRK
ncbi:MAG: UTP--glucose-1-phosphate uridylyltransferase GalU [Actinobacteria bacterium]|jgi:UTP--glucose-1-phosphate uridylyltransferase|uniref:UTP--glucose-1-phosphate uridylyltransferase n=1 Tax=freshwater metagenome TaxID=449393 RepID=A0A6J6FTP2_9ZZZZ|nr:UTP--glucose-1-phosphate uridylyltransferase GalU [Actinomycetota bacterium]